MLKLMRYVLPLFIIIPVFITCQKDLPTEAIPTENILDPQVVLNQVSLDSLSQQVSILSGEHPFVINDTFVTIAGRYSFDPGNALSAIYLERKLLTYNLEVHFLDFSSTGRNVYTVQYGEDKPDEYYIIGAHYDSLPDSSISPGADDNASGCATVMESARILSQYKSRYSVIYAFWDEEEQGLRGSSSYASRAAQ